MNVIGRTNSGSVVVGMSVAESLAIEKLADSRRPMPSGLILAEISETQIEVLGKLARTVKGGKK
jgi:hypothetical protein